MQSEPTAPPDVVRSVGLVVNAERAGAVVFANEFSDWLRDRGLQVCVTRNVTEASNESDGVFARLASESDLVVVLGGDGSVLGAARRAAPGGKLILGVHWGGMGFLSECHPDDARDAIERVLRGEYYVEERRMLLAEVWRGEEKLCNRPALNDVAVTRETLSRILRLEVTIEGEVAASYQGDGLLVSTATGSTGHSLSAGGPVLDPCADVFAVTPICPHSLNGRAIIIPTTKRVSIRHFSPLARVIATIDGQVGTAMESSDRLEVSRAPWPARLVRLGPAQFYQNLSDKLHWKL